MQFSRRTEDLDLYGNQVRIQELSAAEFQTVTAIEDEGDQLLELVWLSLETKPASKDEILQWPHSIVSQLTSSVMALNGLTEQGN